MYSPVVSMSLMNMLLDSYTLARRNMLCFIRRVFPEATVDAAEASSPLFTSAS